MTSASRLGSCMAAVMAAICLLQPREAVAEPYIAVETGLKCASCHTNPTGGGKRNLFGMTYARTNIAERRILSDDDAMGWNSEINRWLGIGGDYRGGYTSVDTPGRADQSDWATRKATAYLEIRPIPGLVTIYADEQVKPGNSIDRETWLLLTPAEGRYTIKAGQFFLPFGLRLQDDSSFVRQRSGINFDTPDDGVEFGVELSKWSAQAAFSNGTAGAGSAPGKDQTSLSAAYILPRWRVGTSLNFIDDPLGDRQMQAIFAGLRTGPVSWLAEIDFISDDLPGGGSNDVLASLFEANWRFRRAHNLKATYEHLDPSDRFGNDEQDRFSIVWEYSPIQLLQTRAGLRSYDGVTGFPTTNRDELFLEAHVYF